MCLRHRVLCTTATPRYRRTVACDGLDAGASGPMSTVVREEIVAHVMVRIRSQMADLHSAGGVHDDSTLRDEDRAVS